jgi:hypothetical protein
MKIIKEGNATDRERWRAPHCARQYHFVIAVWSAKEAQSIA